jgi:hypothetical protein
MAHGKAADQWVKTYTLPAGGQLEVINVNGTIEVSGGDSDVEVRFDREVDAESDDAARAVLKELTIAETVAGNRVKVEVPQRGERTGGWRMARVKVTGHVRVPRGLDPTFRTENGPIRLQNVQGQITASTVNGPITGTGLGGVLKFATVNGPLQIAVDSVGAGSSLTTVNGPLRLQLAAAINADIEATAVNGPITVDEQLALSRTDGGGAKGGFGVNRLTGTLNGGGPKIVIQTSNGPLRIEGPSNRRDGAGR